MKNGVPELIPRRKINLSKFKLLLPLACFGLALFRTDSKKSKRSLLSWRPLVSSFSVKS